MNKQRYALITGANGGIGVALCSAYTDAGYTVIATDMQEHPVPGLRMNCYLQLNLIEFVEDSAYARQVFEKLDNIIDSSGLACLVNNAAIQILGGVESLTREDFNTSLQTNTLAPFFLSQALLKHLEKAKGSIVNISSIHAKLTKRNFVAYATTKAALSGMTKAMAVDIGNKVRVNAIEPAAVDTPMLKAGFLADENKIEALRKMHPTGNIAESHEIASVAIMLTDNTLPFLNGAIIEINGGINSCLKDVD
jgi:NAD(P)-dependent dehydrogenase (short-subunit alcohol dehydrogenase family)